MDVTEEFHLEGVPTGQDPSTVEFRAVVVLQRTPPSLISSYCAENRVPSSGGIAIIFRTQAAGFRWIIMMSAHREFTRRARLCLFVADEIPFDMLHDILVQRSKRRNLTRVSSWDKALNARAQAAPSFGLRSFHAFALTSLFHQFIVLFAITGDLKKRKLTAVRSETLDLQDPFVPIHGFHSISMTMSKPSKSPPLTSEHSPSSKLLRTTLEGAVLSAVSNSLAQGLKAYREGWSSVDPVAFVQFIILAIITTPPNYKWQSWLEETFPTYPERANPQKAGKKEDDTLPKDEKTALSIPNTIAKFVLDQTFGAVFNTVWFIFMINLLRGQSFNHIITLVQRDFLSMIMAGYKFWPIITIMNLVVVPFDQRMLVGGLAGLVWGMYISLTQM
ncbi:hypothetical protein H2200_000975 [Cladophialophora chaetospira]|uniref:Uncharacterized protein n=1 Tax=Cladophialophora chaetospira TaxID=386627 RepID=A0AA38XPK3_9EURO|nr:hypothetical protein H2200_000975 [Cladophialophora chaetospira]